MCFVYVYPVCLNFVHACSLVFIHGVGSGLALFVKGHQFCTLHLVCYSWGAPFSMSKNYIRLLCLSRVLCKVRKTHLHDIANITS